MPVLPPSSVFLLACALLGAAAPVAAEGLSLDAETGLAGGSGLSLTVSERVGLRLGVSSAESDRASAEPGGRVAGLGLLADWRFGDGLRLTGGALYHRGASGLRLVPGPSGSLGLGGSTAFSAAGTPGLAPALVDPGRWRLAPYLGVGWSSRPVGGQGLGFHADVGLAFQAFGAGLDDSGPGLLADPASRRLDDERLRDDSRPTRGWPVMSFGVNWGF